MGLNSAVTLWGVGIALVRNSPHAVGRTGALIAAVTGLFVIWQVVEELRMERIREGSPPLLSDEETEFGLPGVERTARRLELAAEHRRESRLRQARLTMVVVIAVWLSIGEALHGFGDLLFEYARGGRPEAENQDTRPIPRVGGRIPPSVPGSLDR